MPSSPRNSETSARQSSSGSVGSETSAATTQDGDTSVYHSDLMTRIAEGQDWQAFEELFSFYGPRVKAMMIKAGADAALAEDLAQETMTKVWRKASFYVSKRGAVSTWIYTIARNTRIDRLRRASSQPYDDIADLEIASDEPTSEDEVSLMQQSQRVVEAVADLPDEQRKVIELAFMHDMAQSEISESLSLPLGTVKSRMRLAYGKLKAKLEDLK